MHMRKCTYLRALPSLPLVSSLASFVAFADSVCLNSTLACFAAFCWVLCLHCEPGLMKHYQPSPDLPKSEIGVLDYDSTVVKSFMDWTEGSIDCLPPNVASEVGLDLWLYELRGKQPPNSEQEASLRFRITQLANQSPYTLHKSIEDRTFKTLLGKEFHWVECPELW